MSIEGKVPLYCKCENCEKFFKIIKKRSKYCGESCRMKAYYKRKKLRNEA